MKTDGICFCFCVVDGVFFWGGEGGTASEIKCDDRFCTYPTG